MVEELSGFLATWCEIANAWIEEHRNEIEEEDGGPTGMTGKACLTLFLHQGADQLLRLAQTLDGR
jgi:hypothetical protein